MFDPHDFSTERLRKLLCLAGEKGFESIFFGDEKYAKRFVLWRHDVDLELPAVLKMAQVEADENIKATYFLMTNSHFYNLFTREGHEVVVRLLALGHRLGLHSDLGLERTQIPDNEFIESKVAQDFEMLDGFFGQDKFSRVVSFHNPPPSILKKSFASFYSTYQAKFFSTIKYLSDSNRIWRDDAPEKWLQDGTEDQLSILLHPVIWAHGGQSMPELVKAYLESLTQSTLQKLVQDDVIVDDPSDLSST